MTRCGLTAVAFTAALMTLPMSPARADIPDGMTCASEPLLIACFRAFDIELRNFHDEQIAVIADHIAANLLALEGHQSYLFTGHASPFGNTSPVEYAENSLGRAANVANAVRERLRTVHGIGPRRVSLLPVGAAVGNLRPGVGVDTQAERALHRRVDFRLIEKPEPPAPQCTKLDRDDVQDIALTLIGREPRQLTVAELFFPFIKEGVNSTMCNVLNSAMSSPTSAKAPGGTGKASSAAIEAQIACIWFDRYVAALKAELSADPDTKLGYAMGTAYAIVDGLERRDRSRQSLTRIPAKFRTGFRLGYADMRLHMTIRASGPGAAIFRAMMEELACKKNGRVQVNAAYDAILSVLIAEALTQAERIAFESRGDCVLTYPRLSTPSCGPVGGG